MDENDVSQTSFPFKPLTPVQERLIKSGIAIRDDEQAEITYQHTVLCQTCLPYRNPGDDTKVWERRQGSAHLRIDAGPAMNPETNKWVQLSLPFGPKPRLVLMHLNAEAIRTGSPEIEVEDSMTAFVKRVLGYSPNGKEMKMMKDQLARLSAATVHLAVVLSKERASQINTRIITAFDLWFPKDDRQRILWPSTVHLSHEYFVSLAGHAVPLDERAISALSHSAMALDIYTWLAQRLHRVERGKPQFITWKALKDQFGWNYKRMVDFRRIFQDALSQVHTQYRAARIETDEGGMTLRNSPPPIKGRFAVINQISAG